MTNPNRLISLRTRLQMVLAQGLSGDALAHAGQVAEVAGVLHEAFEPEGFSATLVGGAAIEIHAPGIYLSGDLDYVIERSHRATKHVDEIFEGLGFKKELRQEDSLDAFVALRKLTRSDQPVTEAVLRNLLEKLGRRGPKG
jgi:hypothetical protein